MDALLSDWRLNNSRSLRSLVARCVLVFSAEPVRDAPALSPQYSENQQTPDRVILRVLLKISLAQVSDSHFGFLLWRKTRPVRHPALLLAATLEINQPLHSRNVLAPKFSKPANSDFFQQSPGFNKFIYIPDVFWGKEGNGIKSVLFIKNGALA